MCGAGLHKGVPMFPDAVQEMFLRHKIVRTCQVNGSQCEEVLSGRSDCIWPGRSSNFTETSLSNSIGIRRKDLQHVAQGNPRTPRGAQTTAATQGEGNEKRQGGGIEPLHVSMPRELKSRPSTSPTHPGSFGDLLGLSREGCFCHPGLDQPDSMHSCLIAKAVHLHQKSRPNRPSCCGLGRTRTRSAHPPPPAALDIQCRAPHPTNQPKHSSADATCTLPSAAWSSGMILA